MVASSPWHSLPYRCITPVSVSIFFVFLFNSSLFIVSEIKLILQHFCLSPSSHGISLCICLCVSVSKISSSSKDTGINSGVQAQSSPVWTHLNLITSLLPNKVIFTGTEGWGLNIHLWRGCSSVQYIWCITLIDFIMLSHACISGITPTWS